MKLIYPKNQLWSYNKQKEMFGEESMKRAPHPFKCRLHDMATFDISSPSSAVGAGFASMGIGMFTIFRPSPILLESLAERINSQNEVLKSFKLFVSISIFLWQALIVFMLFIGGILVASATKHKRRDVFLIHPWGLMLLYLDVFVWFSLSLSLHISVSAKGPLNENTFKEVTHPSAFFAIIYAENFFYFLGYYTYATYFIAAELAVIEKFY